MPRDHRKYLYDIVQAADRIATFTQGKSQDDYLQDELLRSAVERQFTLIGEAVNQLSNHHQEVAAQLTDRKRIIAFRNILIHAYTSVDDLLVWSLLSMHLPTLRREAAALLA